MGSVEQVERHLTRRNLRGLLRALRDRNLLVRRRAAQALGELGHPDAVPALVKAVRENTDQYVVRWSIEALGRIGGTDAIDALTRLMFSANRTVSTLAEQVLGSSGSPRAALAVTLREAILQSDWATLNRPEPDAGHVLGLIVQSEQYATWPSGKRREVAAAAVRLGGGLPAGQSRELADMGVFVSGVHTVGDLLRALQSPSISIRIAAADKLGMAGISLARGPLFRRFKREVRSPENIPAAAAMARALARLGDDRALIYYRRQLHMADGPMAASAARGLAEVGTPAAALILFRFAADPPPPPGYRNVQVVLTVLESLGHAGIDMLLNAGPITTSAEKRLLAGLVARLRHPLAGIILSDLGRDSDPVVKAAAVNGLVRLNSAAAAMILRDLDGEVPRDQLIAALAQITDPAAPRYLRALAPDATVVDGVVRDDRGKPLPGADVQVVREQHLGGTQGWGWSPLSARAVSDDAGHYTLCMVALEDEWAVHLKVVTPQPRVNVGGVTYTAPITLHRGRINRVDARLDAFFNRLMITVEAD
ncbi:MAG: hypothetical protein Kow00124_03950 [Anaerolineae bacterium]